MRVLNIRLMRMIWKHKGQFVAATAVVIIGLMVFTATGMAVKNLDTTLEKYYEITEFADMFVEVVKIPESAVHKIENLDFVERAEGRIVFDVPLRTEGDDEKVNVRIISYNTEEHHINKHYLLDGSLSLRNEREVHVIKMFADARNIQVGDTLRTQIQGDSYKLEVKGIVANPEYTYLMENEQSLLPDPGRFGVLFVGHEFAQNSYGMRNSYNEVVLKLKEGTNTQYAQKELEKMLDKYGVKRVYKRKDQLSNRMVHEEIESGKKTSQTVPIIFLSVAAAIISVMVQRLVRNDRVTIGVFKALGYTNTQITVHYTMLSLGIGLVGSVFGILFGTLLSGAMAQMYVDMIFNIPILYGKIYWEYYIGTVGLASVFCILAGLWGAQPVMKIMPADSMRPEAPKMGKRIWIERITWFWKRFTFSWKMVIRNILRSKKRFLFITLGISLTFSVTVIPLYQALAFKDIFVSHYSEFQTMDYTVKFTRPQNENMVLKVDELVESERIEPLCEYPFEVTNGWKEKVVNVVGIRQNSQLYHFKSLGNDPIQLPRRGIFISKGVADLLNVQKGDFVTLKSYIPDRDDQEVQIVEVIKQKLGMNIYMELETMQSLLADEELITGLAIESKANIKPELENVKGILSVQSVEDMQNVFMEFLDLTKVTIVFLVIFSGVLGFAVVYNSTVMSINERQLEFSSLRVMGFTKVDIFKLILKENAIMTVLGLLMGLPVGRWMISSVAQAFSTELYTLEAIASPVTYMQAIVMTIIFVSLAQVATYGKIHRLHFIDALKNRTA